MRDIRRLDILWTGEEVAEYERLREEAAKVQDETQSMSKTCCEIILSKKAANKVLHRTAIPLRFCIKTFASNGIW